MIFCLSNNIHAFCNFQDPASGISSGSYDPPYENLATVKMEGVESLPTDQLEDSNSLCVTPSASLDLHVGNLTEARPRLESTEEMPFDTRDKEESTTVISLIERDCQKSRTSPEHHDGETVLSQDRDHEAGSMLHEDQLKGKTGAVRHVHENLGSRIQLRERNNGVDQWMGCCNSPEPSTLHSGPQEGCRDPCTDQRNMRDMPEVAECADQFSFLGIAQNTSRNRVRKKNEARVDFNAKLFRSRCSHRCRRSRPNRAVTCARQRKGRHQRQGWDGLLLPTADRKLVHKSTCHKYVGDTELPNWPLWASAEKTKPLPWQMIRLEDNLQVQSVRSEDHQLSISESTGCFKICCREGLFGESKTTDSIGMRHCLKATATQKSETRHRWSSGPQVLCHARQPAVTTGFCAEKSDRGRFMVPKTPRPRRASPVGRSPATMPLMIPHKKKVLQTTPAMSALLHSLKNASKYQYSKIN